jgi:UDP:flavonoid glycosyltransferase YjiC (YdhE family)
MPEQVANADRVHELGLRERLDADTLTPQTLRETIARVTHDHQLRANLNHMRTATRQNGGAARGADIIEQYLP